VQVSWSELSAHAGGGKGAVQLASGDVLATRTQWRAGETAVVCARSHDGGRHWEDVSVIAQDRVRVDMGDGHLIQLADGAVLFSYRYNHTQTNKLGLRQYSIRTAISFDAGQTWQPHSVVAESQHHPAAEPAALRGLWSSFLLLKRDGTLQCYYDDEDTPHHAGFFQHQWVTMKTWDASRRQWVDPVSVSRAHNPQHLSRDGMPSVVELPSSRLLCVLESVEVDTPHANCIRQVTSDDGGRTWSWQRGERDTVFKTRKRKHLAISPWVSRLPGGGLICVFATDEDQPFPGRSGTPPWRLKTDVQSVTSANAGHGWSPVARSVFVGAHKCYAPGVLLLQDSSLLATFQDFSTWEHVALRGLVTP